MRITCTILTTVFASISLLALANKPRGIVAHDLPERDSTVVVSKTINRWVDSLDNRNFSDDMEEFKEDVKQFGENVRQGAKEFGKEVKEGVETYTPEVKKLLESVGGYFER